MKHWKTTLGGAVSGLASLFAGIEMVRHGQAEQGYALILAGAGLIYKGWNSADKGQ